MKYILLLFVFVSSIVLIYVLFLTYSSGGHPEDKVVVPDIITHGVNNNRVELSGTIESIDKSLSLIVLKQSSGKEVHISFTKDTLFRNVYVDLDSGSYEGTDIGLDDVTVGSRVMVLCYDSRCALAKKVSIVNNK